MGNFDNDLFVKRIKIKDKIEPQLFEEYPLNINAIRFLDSFTFTTPVTIFQGENGCGKSTLIDAIAGSLGIPIMGGSSNLSGLLDNYNLNEESESILKDYIIVEKVLRSLIENSFLEQNRFISLPIYYRMTHGL